MIIWRQLRWCNSRHQKPLKSSWQGGLSKLAGLRDLQSVFEIAQNFGDFGNQSHCFLKYVRRVAILAKITELCPSYHPTSSRGLSRLQEVRTGDCSTHKRTKIQLFPRVSPPPQPLARAAVVVFSKCISRGCSERLETTKAMAPATNRISGWIPKLRFGHQNSHYFMRTVSTFALLSCHAT